MSFTFLPRVLILGMFIVFIVSATPPPMSADLATYVKTTEEHRL
jgi:hypothetical protein